jgi:hypothetical protein
LTQVFVQQQKSQISKQSHFFFFIFLFHVSLKMKQKSADIVEDEEEEKNIRFLWLPHTLCARLQLLLLLQQRFSEWEGERVFV